MRRVAAVTEAPNFRTGVQKHGRPAASSVIPEDLLVPGTRTLGTLPIAVVVTIVAVPRIVLTGADPMIRVGTRRPGKPVRLSVRKKGDLWNYFLLTKSLKK